MKPFTSEQLQEALNIISAESFLSALKKKRNQFIKIHKRIKGQQQFAEENAILFSLHDDCRESYTSQRDEKDSQLNLIENLARNYFSSQEVVEQSRLVGILKQQFKEKHPEQYEAMIVMLGKTQKQREHLKQKQQNAKKKAAKYCANLALTLHGLNKELHEENINAPEFERQVKKHCNPRPAFAKNNNPINSLPDFFMESPSKMDDVINTAHKAFDFPMTDERLELIASLVEHIDKNRACF